MSSVTVPLYHYALIKGFLSGKDAPSEVLAAVEALYMAAVQSPLRADALEAIQSVKEAAERLAGLATASPAVEITIAQPDLPLVIPEDVEIALAPLTKRALEEPIEPANTAAASSEPQTDEAKVTAFLEAAGAEHCPPSHATGDDHEAVVDSIEVKKRKPWSPEARAAAAERMRARQAAGLMGRRKSEISTVPASAAGPTFEISKASTPEPQTASKPNPSPAIDPTRLITVHNGYAGGRKDGQLLDADWPDIKSRLAKGETKAAIAGDYEAELEELDYFIASCQRREARHSLGEAHALPLSQRGGAS